MSGGEGPPEGRSREEMAPDRGRQSVRFLVGLRLGSLRTDPVGAKNLIQDVELALSPERT